MVERSTWALDEEHAEEYVPPRVLVCTGHSGLFDRMPAESFAERGKHFRRERFGLP